MKRLHNSFPLFPSLLILLTIVLFAGNMGCQNPAATEPVQLAKGDSTAVFILKKETLQKEISVPGELIPLERAEIFAKVSGYVNSLKVDIGDGVQKGQVLVELDAPEMIADYARIQSVVQAAQSTYRGSKDVYLRMMNAALVAGTVAPVEIERVKNQMQVDSLAYEASQAQLNAYAQLKSYLVIRAPFSGIITQRNVDTGTLVGTGNTTPLLVIEKNHTLRLRLPIPEAYTADNPAAASISFTVDAYPGVLFDALFSRKAGALNQINRTETWEYLYNNRDNLLKSGMFANASILFRRSAATFVVPTTATVTNLEKRFVIRLNQRKAEWIDVRNGMMIDGRSEIFGNVQEGDTLLLRGSDEIKPGQVIIPKMISH